MAVEFHMIWREQIRAVEAIRKQYGDAAAFDYIVGEKLMNYAEAAEDRPEFSRELPRFVAAIREIFDPDTMRIGLRYLARYLEQEEAQAADMLREKQRGLSCETAHKGSMAEEDDDDDVFEDAEILGREIRLLASKRKRLEFLRDLLTAERLGTS